MPKISVIIPVYNVEKYLPECLDSLLAQTFSDFEAICVDDGSPDNSAQILQKYVEKDKRFKVITQKNQGLSGARNTGLEHAKGRYIFFLDSDDTIPQNALEIMFKIAETTKAPVVVSESNKKSDKEIPFSYQLFHHPLMDLVRNRRIYSSAWNKLYRADILKNHRFILGIYFEDWPFLTTLFGKIDFFAVTKIPCYYYREDGPSITRSKFNQKKVDSYLTGIRFVYSFYKKRLGLSLAQKRIAVAVKMMVNKVYKAKDPALINYTLEQLDDLFQKGVVSKYRLPLKTQFRLWKMHFFTKKVSV